MAHPFLERATRPHVEGRFEAEEVGLAANNVSLPLEALRYDVTPVGLHYTLSHFDIPALDAAAYRLSVEDKSFSLEALKALPQRTVRATLECAGNGRAGMTPRYPSMPWTHGAVGTAEWTGTPLYPLLEKSISSETREIAFLGADRGFDSGVEHHFGRSLSVEDAMRPDVLLAWAMNGAPLAPQHGAPLRLVVPGWYGMASVKWLTRIELLERPFDGYQQRVGYHYRKRAGEPGEPVRHARVKSLMVPPGVPDWYTRRRMVDAGRVAIEGRAWSGGGVPVKRIELGIDGEWRDGEIEPATAPFAWQRWRCEWHATPGEHELACRATDASGAVQPLAPDWNTAGMGNNAVQRIAVTVR
jgi:DMSO/TMAO reductase YedYZ molybdopterin-dependent catalytic subunit